MAREHLASLGEPWSPFQTLMSPRTAALVGTLGAIATIALADLPTAGLALGCVSVVGLYAVYPSFSLAWGNRRERLVEWSFMALGAVSITLAVTHDARWLALGWAAHGAWDALHHRERHLVGLHGIPEWYIRSCLVWDLGAAIGLAALI